MKNFTVVFDLDGTLVDTAPDLINAVRHVLGLVDVQKIDDDALRGHISFGGRAMISEGLRLAGREPVADNDLDRLFDEFVDYYASHIAIESTAYRGVELVLRALNETGARLAVCTNKREDLSRMLLKELGLHPYFHAVVGRDTLPVHKPDPGHLIGAIILADGNPGRAVLVGDSETDVNTAKQAGIPVVGCTFGYSPVPMEQLAPDAIITGYGELQDAISSALKAVA
ncbi:MAG: HAD-IA family hydrolase [Hyphomicrobiaceae bacterium]